MLAAVLLPLALLTNAPAPMAPAAPVPRISGDYFEVRSCDVFTGPCYANCEVNEVGKEATLAWKVREGEVDGVDVAGLSVVAVVKASRTLGDPYKNPLPAKSALLFDDSATTAQRAALKRFALAQLGSMAGTLVRELSVPIRLDVGCCDKKGCGKLVAGDVVSAETRCLGDCDHICGNETAFYPPLTDGVSAIPAYTLDNKVDCADAFGSRWSLPDKRGAFIGAFESAAPAPALMACALGITTDDVGGKSAVKEKSAPAATGGDSPYAIVKLDGKDAAPPSEVADAIKTTLGDHALRVTRDGKPLYDLWLANEIALADKPDTGTGIKYGEIALGALVGVMRAHGGESDYRQADVKEGVYILRYAVQPMNGNHLGTADTRDFVMLSGAADDLDPAPVSDADKLVERSLLVSPTDHCLILYLRVPEKTPAEPVIVKHPDRDEWRVDVAAKGRGKSDEKAKDLSLGIVVVGISPHP